MASISHRVNSIHVYIWETNVATPHGIYAWDSVTTAWTSVFSAGITSGPSEATPGAIPRDSKPTLKDPKTLPSQLFL